MTSIKKLVGRSPDRGSKIRDTLEARQFVASEVGCLSITMHPTPHMYRTKLLVVRSCKLSFSHTYHQTGNAANPHPTGHRWGVVQWVE